MRWRDWIIALITPKNHVQNKEIIWKDTLFKTGIKLMPFKNRTPCGQTGHDHTRNYSDIYF